MNKLINDAKKDYEDTKAKKAAIKKKAVEKRAEGYNDGECSSDGE